MIRTEAEYKEAVRRLKEERERLLAHESRLRSEFGLDAAGMKRALDPVRCFQGQLEDDIVAFESRAGLR